MSGRCVNYCELIIDSNGSFLFCKFADDWFVLFKRLPSFDEMKSNDDKMSLDETRARRRKTLAESVGNVPYTETETDSTFPIALLVFLSLIRLQ